MEGREGFLYKKIPLGGGGWAMKKQPRKVVRSEDVRRMEIVLLFVCACQAHHLSIGYAHKPRSQA